MADYQTPPPYPAPVLPRIQPSQIIDGIRYFTDSGFSWLTHLGLSSMVSGNVTEDVIQAAMRFPARIQETIVTTSRDLMPVRRWQEHRESYAVHPGTTASMVRLKSDMQIPASALRGLRHSDPLFLLPGAPVIRHADGRPGRVLAFYLTGAISTHYTTDVTLQGRDGRELPSSASLSLSTHDPKINSYHVMAISEVHSEDGRMVVDMDYSHFNIPILDDFTLDEIVEETVHGFSWGMGLTAPVADDLKEPYLRRQATVALTHLLYVISKSAEIGEPKNDRPPAKWKKASGTPKPDKPFKIRPTGYRMGAAIEAFQRRARAGATSGIQPGATGRKMPAHIRSPHQHLYRVGPGRQEIDLKFLGPIPVNQSANDGRTVTIHPVK